MGWVFHCWGPHGDDHATSHHRSSPFTTESKERKPGEGISEERIQSLTWWQRWLFFRVRRLLGDVSIWNLHECAWQKQVAARWEDTLSCPEKFRHIVSQTNHIPVVYFCLSIFMISVHLCCIISIQFIHILICHSCHNLSTSISKGSEGHMVPGLASPRMWETGWTPMDFVRGLGPFGCLATGKPREARDGSLMEDLSKFWENLQETMVFPIKYGGVPANFGDRDVSVTFCFFFFVFGRIIYNVYFPVTSMVLSKSLGLRWLPSKHHMLVGFPRCVSHITYGFQQPRIQSCYLRSFKDYWLVVTGTMEFYDFP